MGYQVWLENGGFQDDDDVAAGDDAKANDDGINPVFYEVCPEYNTCSSYKSLCEEEVEESFTQYFECTQAVSSSGQVGYVGPHCAEDGFTVTLGVYSDEFCNQYIGNGVDISNFIGMEIDAEDDELKPWYNSANGALEVLKYSNEENVCIPCNKADLPYEESDYMEQYEAQNDGNNQDEEDDNRVQQEVNDICENLYLVSARCDKHFRSYNSRSKMALWHLLPPSVFWVFGPCLCTNPCPRRGHGDRLGVYGMSPRLAVPLILAAKTRVLCWGVHEQMLLTTCRKEQKSREERSFFPKTCVKLKDVWSKQSHSSEPFLLAERHIDAHKVVAWARRFRCKLYRGQQM